MITAAQCRMARAALRWSVKELSERSHVGSATIQRFEAELSSPVHATKEILRQTFEKAGVEFTNGDRPGVRLKATKTAR
jgi:transcriptional regulator with XRE-family HTH domain